jgi:hypothetical protein
MRQVTPRQPQKTCYNFTVPKNPAQRRPKADVLKIDGDWKDAVRRSFGAKNAAGGWPKAGE